MTGFYIIELINNETKSELKKRFAHPDYKFPKIKHGQIVIPEEVLKQMSQEEFNFYNRLMRQKPCVK